ncbi:HAD-IA family hydrolase [Burkholderiaceae bacterium FT117]|uniref:HAD-IA family hydrolase n=1 Tax=Zeimonas sediminis TaxID=2944268 RepID=UPI0023431443|nr:HAD-IA family hydrolase [Zeimonas sediminis]MCM5570044.1 HAD-IA family hydrolase [Zeimonas sediminis]
MLQAVFFDLDGTLADTARDLVEPILAMRAERGLEPVPFEALRPYASMGARGLILRGFGVERDDEAFPALRDEFLARYERAMLVHTRLFEGMDAVLDALDRAGIRWGVISNKVERYVRPIVAGLGLGERSVCAIGGDTTPFAKPHPEPLLHGARLAGVDPARCVYVGDDLRDIEAGRAAAMRTVAAAYGFCGVESAPADWGADHLIDTPLQLLHALELARA